MADRARKDGDRKAEESRGHVWGVSFSHATRVVSFLSALIGIPAALAVILGYFEPEPEIRASEKPQVVADVAGHWVVWNVIETTTHEEDLGLRVGYRLFLRQEGTKVSGSGEKWWENDTEVTGRAHTPVELDGVMDGKTLRLSFVEEGTRRQTRGEYIWQATGDQDVWVGRFQSTAALSSGPSKLSRDQ